MYPLLGVSWEPNPDWNVQLGFPNSHVSYQLSDRLSTQLRFAPDGNEWQVFDRSLAIRSQFVYEAYALEWAIDWDLLENFTLSASVGRQFDNQYEMTVLDQSRVHLTADDVTRIGAALEWRF